MSNKKPENINEYKDWLKKKQDVTIDVRTSVYYVSVAHKIREDFTKSFFWKDLTQQIKQIGQEYYLQSQYYLFINENIPDLFIKSFDSFLLKTFRHNIINNENWPKEPQNGWIFPENWFVKVTDILRTCFVVKYIDGINFFINKIKKLCQENEIVYNIDFEAKEEGYYAAHVYLNFQSNIPKIDWDTEKINAVIELQITTQLQEVIRKLLHEHYETRRKRIDADKLKWQWDYKSDEFAANYLGHILHYVEGMIMDVRDRHIINKDGKR